ncbi:MAG: M23 family metallopeptidase [Microbacterium sp.]|uniref:M23 family metallopeptidase n=1 Tax=Microbacterium sp. TaxID=51671 RepID=UPI003F7FB688
MPHVHRRALRRAATVAASMVVAFGLLGTGVPALASTDAGAEPTPVADDPTPASSEPGTAIPSPPAPSPPAVGIDPAAPDPTPAGPSPSDPTPPPQTSTPAPSSPGPSDGAPAQDEWMVVGGATADGSAPGTGQAAVPVRVPIAASFAVVYPTNPWIYNGSEGTRYLDSRETVAGVTRLHMGIDAQGGVRQPIFAVADGIVIDGTWGTTSRDRNGFGNNVQIAHGDGFATRYAHLADAPLVRVGDHVSAGQVIGYMGGSQRGNLHALPRHLHFEVTKDGRNIDPLSFLGGADAPAATGANGATVVAEAPVVAASPAAGAQLHEIRPTPDGGLVSIATGIPVASSVFTSVLIGGWSADTFVSEGGRLLRISVLDGAWTKTDTGLALDATSLSGVFAGTDYPDLFAVENGMLYLVSGDASGWTKSWTGHYFTGSVSAVRLSNGRVGAMLEEDGYVSLLRSESRGRWSIEDTGIRVDGPVSAVDAGGAVPEAVGVLGGSVVEIGRRGIAWDASPTGLAASGPLAATFDLRSGWPTAWSADTNGIGEVHVADQRWKRRTFPLESPATGPLSAVVIDRVGTVIYAVG